MSTAGSRGLARIDRRPSHAGSRRVGHWRLLVHRLSPCRGVHLPGIAGVFGIRGPWQPLHAAATIGPQDRYIQPGRTGQIGFDFGILFQEVALALGARPIVADERDGGLPAQ